jgi:hypothetical protein
VLPGAFFLYYLRVGAQGTSIGFLNHHPYAAPVLQGIAVILVMFVLPTGVAGLLRKLATPAARALSLPRRTARSAQ